MAATSFGSERGALRAAAAGVVAVAVATTGVLATACPKRHKQDAGVVVGDGDGGAASDAGGADGGSTTTTATTATAATDAGAATTAPPDGSARLIVSGPVERDAQGTWKLRVRVEPAPPNAPSTPPAQAPQIVVEIQRPGGPIKVGLATSFQLQGISAVGPISEGTSGTIMPTTIDVPPDAIAISYVADGKPLSTAIRQVLPFQIARMNAKPQKGALQLELAFEPKAPVAWVAYVELRPGAGEFVKVGAGDDANTSGVIAGDAGDPSSPEVMVRVDATDGFSVFTQAAKFPRPKQPDKPAAGGSVVDGGTAPDAG